MKILFILSFLPCLGLCQVKLSGFIFDKNNSPIPFASIGIAGKPVGTLSNENGSFDLKLSESEMNDSIRVSAISYKPVSFLASTLAREKKIIILEFLPLELEEVVVIPRKIRYRLLGSTHYNKNNCTGFTSIDGNWKGSESAVLIKNKHTLLMENFSFFVIKNTYEDSVMFRLMFYETQKDFKPENKNDQPYHTGTSVLKKPVIFKVGIHQGKFTLPLRDYEIQVTGDFFVSLECLLNEMEIARFCFSSSGKRPAFFKAKSFASWFNTPYGGADFNVKVIVLN